MSHIILSRAQPKSLHQLCIFGRCKILKTFNFQNGLFVGHTQLFLFLHESMNISLCLWGINFCIFVDGFSLRFFATSISFYIENSEVDITNLNKIYFKTPNQTNHKHKQNTYKQLIFFDHVFLFDEDFVYYSLLLLLLFIGVPKIFLWGGVNFNTKKTRTIYKKIYYKIDIRLSVSTQHKSKHNEIWESLSSRLRFVQ